MIKKVLASSLPIFLIISSFVLAQDEEAVEVVTPEFGSSNEFPMKFLMPVEDNAGIVILDIWNTVDDNDEWTLHGKITAKYTKQADTEYEVGICIPMDAPYTDKMDCFSIRAG